MRCPQSIQKLLKDIRQRKTDIDYLKYLKAIFLSDINWKINFMCRKFGVEKRYANHHGVVPVVHRHITRCVVCNIISVQIFNNKQDWLPNILEHDCVDYVDTFDTLTWPLDNKYTCVPKSQLVLMAHKRKCFLVFLSFRNDQISTISHEKCI